MLTTKQAADRLGLTRSKTVVEYIRRGLIKAERFGRDYAISEQEIERFIRERRKVGKPKKA